MNHFVKAALEASIVACPDAPGLSKAQLIAVGVPFGLEEGELLDAAIIGCDGDVEDAGGRYRLTPKGGARLCDFSRVPKDDLRNPAAFEAVQIFFRKLAQRRRVQNAVAEKGAVLAHVVAHGTISENDGRAAIAMLVLAGCLAEDADRLSLISGFERFSAPSEALQSAIRYEPAIPPMAKILAAVRSALVQSPHIHTSAPVDAEKTTSSTSSGRSAVSPPTKNPTMKPGADFSAAVVFVLVKGLRDCTDGPQIPQALSALNAALRGITSEVFVLSTITGLIVVIPDQADWGLDETMSELSSAKVGFPLRVGIAHGILDVVGDVDGEINVVGPAINIAARLATAANNSGCLVHESYATHIEGTLSTSDWLHRSRRAPLTVTGKPQDPPFVCFVAPTTFQAIPLENTSKVQFRRAVMLAYDLPMFSAGDRAQLRKRFNGVVDTFEKVRATSSAGSKAVLSPGGDGGVVVFLGETFADVIALAERLRLLATTEDVDRNRPISVESRVGIHYGHVALYTNARGVERPAGRDMFVADELAGDEIARGRAGIVVTHVLADSLMGGSRLRLEAEFEALEPIKSGPAAGIPRYVRRGSALQPIAASRSSAATDAPPSSGGVDADQERRDLELARLRHEMRLRVSIEPAGTATSGDRFSAKWRIRNDGERACEISDVRFQLHTTEAFNRYVETLGFVCSGTFVLDHHPPGFRPQSVLHPRAFKDYDLVMAPMAVRMLLRQANAPCPEGWSPDWVVPAITCTVVGPDGTSKTLRASLPLVGTIEAYAYNGEPLEPPQYNAAVVDAANQQINASETRGSALKNVPTGMPSVNQPGVLTSLAEDIYNLLRERVPAPARRDPCITYSELIGQLSTNHKVLDGRDPRLARALGDIVRLCQQRSWPLLSALVVRADSRRPGAGYHDVACPDERDEARLDIEWANELGRVKQHVYPIDRG